MVIRQGDLFWLDYDEPEGSEPGFRRPVLVVQNNLYNEREIRTTVVCALTSSLRRAQNRGNILLETGEGNLSKQSVVIVSQVDTVDKDQLRDFIGRLSSARVRQVLAAMWGIFEPIDADEKEG